MNTSLSTAIFCFIKKFSTFFKAQQKNFRCYFVKIHWVRFYIGNVFLICFFYFGVKLCFSYFQVTNIKDTKSLKTVLFLKMIICVEIQFFTFSLYNFKNKTDETTILLFKLIAVKLMTFFRKKNVVLQIFQLNKNLFLTDVSLIERS